MLIKLQIMRIHCYISLSYSSQKDFKGREKEIVRHFSLNIYYLENHANA